LTKGRQSFTVSASKISTSVCPPFFIDTSSVLPSISSVAGLPRPLANANRPA
jgi:hypothetical protein